jgi:hypothetical protein
MNSNYPTVPSDWSNNLSCGSILSASAGDIRKNSGSNLSMSSRKPPHEVPKDRWDWKTFYNEERGKWGSIYSKWGGFLDDIAVCRNNLSCGSILSASAGDIRKNSGSNLSMSSRKM